MATQEIKVDKQDLLDIYDALVKLSKKSKNTTYQYQASILGQSLADELEYTIDLVKGWLGIDDDE